MELIDLTINSARYDGFLGVYGVYIYIFLSSSGLQLWKACTSPLALIPMGHSIFFSWEPVQGWPFRSGRADLGPFRSVPFCRVPCGVEAGL